MTTAHRVAVLTLVLALGCASGCASATTAGSARRFRMLTLNIQLDANDGKTIQGIVDLIRRSNADVVGLQEVGNSGPVIARKLGFNYAKVGDDTAVLTRYAVTAHSPGPRAVTVSFADGRQLRVVDLHLYYKPYQPYQLLHIPYDGPDLTTEAEAIAAAKAARGADTTAALQELGSTDTAEAPTIVVGDFNEPSHLDWTAAAARAKRHPIKVAWPQTSAFAAAGFKDAYRELYPDEMAKPGNTWTPTTSPTDPKDHHDRIDFVLYRGAGLAARWAGVVGESAQTSDVVVTPYPTDHRGVVADFTLQ